MARADLLKKLFNSYQRRDDVTFQEIANVIIEDERKKHHQVLANELKRILSNGSRSLERVHTLRHTFDPIPMDNERNTHLLTIKHPDRYFQDLVLEDHLKTSLERVLTEIRGWDILEASGLKPVRRLLLCGPSGCGKTATAEAIATELGLPLLYVRFDSVVSSLLGETAANVRKVFEYSERGKWVLFFDEFDAIGRSRDDATEHGEIKRLVNSFLQLLDGFNGRTLVIAATNFEKALDPAIWRRFDDVLRFGLPDKSGLENLISKCLRPLSVKKSHVTYIARALDGATYADAERVSLDIRKKRALEGDSVVRMLDIDDAISRYLYRKNVLQVASEDVPPPTIDRK